MIWQRKGSFRYKYSQFYINDGISCNKDKIQTCNAKDSATKIKPARLSVSPKEAENVVWRYSLEYTWIVVYDAVNSYKWGSQGPCSHYWRKEETHARCTKLLQQEQNDQDNSRECFHKCCNSMTKTEILVIWTRRGNCMTMVTNSSLV